ncbi:DUF4417 domain-containing protein [Peptoniphilus duerdenii]|uniref:DUF4417 domain-containing protein n=1 Tax=Peptoniphilus duerdenii TaxID=507750 RepID=UPI0023F18246|nr:DUF4417 domain-containing protein [Peptoniphilus duerdenii]
MSNYKYANSGFNPKLIENLSLVGKYDIPLIKKEEIGEIKDFIPFEKRNLYNGKNVGIHFYSYDGAFKQIINNPEKYRDELKKFNAVISPDFSICYDMPIPRQIYSTYMNRVMGAYYQNNGIKVIPNVRWGDSRSYEFCFEGLEKEGTYAIGSYGQIKRNSNRYYFEKGLEEFFKRLNPEKIYVCGAMPDSIFGNYRNETCLISIEPYTSKIHRGAI